MRRSMLCALSALTVGLSLLAAPGVSSGAAAGAAPARREASSLTISPMLFVGGQSLTFVGVLADAPNSRLRIETLFNRTGDSWSTRDAIVGTTNSTGAYSFSYPGPNNYGIRYRVRASNGATSPAVVLEPRQQEVVLSLNGGEDQAWGAVASGDTYDIDVDTTPTGRGKLGLPAPAFPGRLLQLQQRVRVDQWETVDQTVSLPDGQAQFSRIAGEPADLAYRVIMAPLVSAGDSIGWFPSHPLELTVTGADGAAPAPTPTPTPTPAPTPAPDADPSTDAAITPVAARQAPARATRKRKGRATPLASQRYTWGPAMFDFAWEEGESLTDKPFRGTRRQGAWLDASDGSGRVAHYNGGMSLSSSVSEFPGNGDHGNTTATLEGNAMTYGRWEFRRRIDVFENGSPDFRIKIDLIPADAGHDYCGPNIVNVAEVTYNSATALLGVSSERANTTWSGSRAIRRVGDGPHSFGVEVTPDHVTWFLDGRSLATVKDRQAAPGVPLTPRLSLLGRSDEEMRRTRVLYDWQRGWPLNKQARKARTGRPLEAGTLVDGC